MPLHAPPIKPDEESEHGEARNAQRLSAQINKKTEKRISQLSETACRWLRIRQQLSLGVLLSRIMSIVKIRADTVPWRGGLHQLVGEQSRQVAPALHE